MCSSRSVVHQGEVVSQGILYIIINLCSLNNPLEHIVCTISVVVFSPRDSDITVSGPFFAINHSFRFLSSLWRR